MRKRHLMLKILTYSLAICIVTLNWRCDNRESNESFIFPKLENIDQAVYNEIQKTCAQYWDLNNMIDTTFKIIQDKDEYVVYCDGYINGVLYEFVIRVNGQGKWINDGRSIKDQSP